MNSEHQITKYKKNQLKTKENLISIEEPLEMIIRYKKNNNWIDNSI